MRHLILSASFAAAIMWLLPSKTAASPEYSRRTQKECNYCHPPANYTLTDAGKYYQAHKTLKGYQPKVEPPKPGTGQPSAQSK